jgi:hypothetical protein
MTTPVDDLPVGTAKTVRPTKYVVSGTPTGPAPTTIAAGRARIKRRRLTGDDYRNQRAMARSVTGYDETSPIWGKRLPVVLQEIDDLLEKATDKVTPLGDKVKAMDTAKTYVKELQKRLATNKLMSV